MKQKKKKPDYTKETSAERKLRIKESGNRYITSFKPSQKGYDRNREKREWK